MNNTKSSIRKCIFFLICIVSSIIIGGCRKENTPIAETTEANKEYDWRWVIKPGEYQDIKFVDEDLIAVKNEEGEYGVLDVQGEEVIPFEYDGISRFCEGLASAEKNEEYMYINRNGDVILSGNFQGAYPISEGMGAVKQGGMWGFVDAKGDMKIDYQYEEVRSFHEGIAAVKTEGKWTFISTEGEQITKDLFDKVDNFSEGLAAVKMNEKWGYINSKGELCIKFLYDEVSGFSEGLAAVSIKENPETRGEWGYIDEKGQVIIDFYFYDDLPGVIYHVGDFHDGMAFVTKGVPVIIDKTGKEIFDGESKFCISEYVYNIEYDIIPAFIYTDEAMRIPKYGLMGFDGNQRLEPAFDYISDLNDTYILVENIIDGEYQQGVIELIEKDKE